MDALAEKHSTQDREDADDMGRVAVRIQLVNAADEELRARRKLGARHVRAVELDALVDTGATMLSVPEDVLKKLGLRVVRKATVTYADGRKETRRIYGPAMIRVMGRTEFISVLAGHRGQPALLGQIPLEGLDLHVDPKGRQLVPNPASPDMPSVEVY